MKRIISSLIGILVFWGYTSGQSSTSYDVEFSRICLIDSIAPDTLVQIWLYTQSNNPGEFRRYFAFDLSSSYTPAGTLRPCCQCLTIASDRVELSPIEPGAWAGGAPYPLRWMLWGLVITATAIFYFLKKPDV